MTIGEYLSPEFFIGRKEQLSWFERILFSQEHWFRPIVVNGAFGSGKTAIIKKFLHSNQERVRNLWFIGQEINEIGFNDHFDKEIEKLSSASDPRRVIVVIDEAEIAGEEAVKAAVRRILNWKIVQSVIVSGARTFSFDESPVLTLAPLSRREVEAHLETVLGRLPDDIREDVIIRIGGNLRMLLLLANAAKEGGIEALKEYLKQPLYDLNQVFPNNTIIEVAKPKIIFVTGELIEALKKEPASIYQLSPRKFEELLAQLLESLGMKIELTQASKDGGCDIIARLNTELGRFLCVIEAKRYSPDNKVGVEIVKQLYATFSQKEATSAMLITTSSFTRGAKDFQQDFQYQLSLKEYTDVVRWIQNYKPDNKTGLFLPE